MAYPADMGTRRCAGPLRERLESLALEKLSVVHQPPTGAHVHNPGTSLFLLFLRVEQTLG